ncbi:hypothetical protein GOQ29_08765 [Clostridium sp. D2Q-14]|uniref:hypothetical protein n=1 Tax=Anaeromonas gelatinilytica TaxID=2683194 RepID=UPI00193BBB77|nr:hypothetical protein [Anaeromonas gelatinilytica]MBS4535705.1 hypothetical protein [Anaeromonas gelatinilytica]
MSNYKEFKWFGNKQMYLNEINLDNCDDIVIGRYGGNTDSGAEKNEDAVFIMSNKEFNWKFAMILDAHTTIQSANLVINTVYNHKEKLLSILNTTKKDMFKNLQSFFFEII